MSNSDRVLTAAYDIAAKRGRSGMRRVENAHDVFDRFYASISELMRMAAQDIASNSGLCITSKVANAHTVFAMS